MTDAKLIQVWGQDLYNYAYAKSMELVGYPDYLVMTIAAVGKINDTLKQNNIATIGVGSN